ncbi:hypothetical protein ACG02S_19065 [Roseateles sp. DC23W]|uniref:J domain-containing protein n=1 Tax=Pelomonas dachongensis TaxID=3299029 RepID=A0ABW7ERC8_9BURK
MWEQDWALLGIEPTTELAAIKKAYALKLKVTRPDDDAEAYQALRAAYERVQQWAKWQCENAASPQPGDEPAVPAPPAPPSVCRANETTPAADTEPAVQPLDLIDALELRWRRDGEAALVQAWGDVRHVLDQQPLSRQAEFSAAFAQWALSLPSLPDALLKALDAHFGWLNDFRTERQLGVELAHALHDALDARLRPAAIDPAVRALVAPLLGLAALRDAGDNAFKLQLLWLLLQPRVARALGLLSVPWLRHLGLDAQAPAWLAAGQKRGLWLRAGLGAALMLAASVGVFGDPAIGGAHAAGWLVATGALLVAGLMVGTLLNVGPALTTPTRRLALPLERWRRNEMQPVLGLVWLLFAAWMAWLDAGSAASTGGPLSVIPGWLYLPAAWLFGLAGLVAAWPLVPLHGCVVAGLSPLVGFLFWAALGHWLPLPSCLLVAVAWMLLAAAVQEERVRAEGLAQWPLRPMLNTLALSDRWTYGVALLPLVVGTAYMTLNDGPVRASTVFLIWVIGNLAVGWLQDKAEAWALKQLPAPAEG